MKTVLLSGAAVNFYLIVAGSLVGLLLKKGLPERISSIINTAMALTVLYIGISGVIADNINVLTIVLSMGVGAVIGELIDIDKWLSRLSSAAQKRFSKNGGNSNFGEGFVTATLVFCVGAMSIVGSINSGMRGDNATLYSKSMIDAITSAMFASSMGIGVMFSALPVLLLEGVITVSAAFLAPYLTDEIIAHIGVIGSILIIVLALNLLKITKIKIANLLPAIFLPIAFCMIF